MKYVLTAAALALLAACAPQTKAPAEAPAEAAAPITPVTTEAPSGAYKLDPSHATLLFRVNHLGFSHFTGRFTKFDAALNLDTANTSACLLNTQ